MPDPAAVRRREHAPHNAMDDAGEVERFRDRCSAFMGALLDELATTPGRARTFPEIEDALGWPRRRIASVLGGVSHLRNTEFGGRRPYRFHGDRDSASGRWELWMDATQAAAIAAGWSDGPRPTPTAASPPTPAGGPSAPARPRR
ncbi:MAG: hypothetical protein JWR63_323 [Conexibacter sp.]|nr:hypothetical protein [Conexibacter sp.]